MFSFLPSRQIGRPHFVVVLLIFTLGRLLCADPGVVIVMPMHNGSDTVSLSIRSVLEQTYRNWDLWVIDDASSDNSREVVQRWANQDSRIHLHSLETNVGPGQARNIGAGIGRRNHRYVAFLDDDDLWAPTKLAKQVEFMERTGAAFSFTAYRRISYDGKQASETLPVPDKLTYHELLTKSPLATAAVMLNIEATGLVEFPEARQGEDLRYWLNLTKQGIEGRGLHEGLVFVRRGGRTLSSNKLQMIQARWDILRRVEGLALPIAGYYFVQYAVRSLLKYHLGYRLTQACPAEIAAYAPGLRAYPPFLHPQPVGIRPIIGE